MRRGAMARIAVLLAWSIFSLLPLYWTFSVSLQEEVTFPPKIFPEKPSLHFYQELLSKPTILGSLGNSLLVCFAAAAIGVTLAILAGYSFSKIKFRGKTLLFGAIMIAFLLPPHMNIVPLYLLYSQLGLLNSLFGIVIIMQIVILPLNIFLFMTYFQTIPDEVVESAKVDGCGHLNILGRIVLPLSAPALIAGFIFAFRFTWSDYILPATFLYTKGKLMYTAALAKVVYFEHGVEWGLLAAGSAILVIPTLLIILFGQRYLYLGLKFRSGVR